MLLKSQCIFAEDHAINSEKDILKLLFSKDVDELLEENLKVDSSLLLNCGIKVDDIQLLKDVWNIDIIELEKGGEEK